MSVASLAVKYTPAPLLWGTADNTLLLLTLGKKVRLEVDSLGINNS